MTRVCIRKQTLLAFFINMFAVAEHRVRGWNLVDGQESLGRATGTSNEVLKAKRSNQTFSKCLCNSIYASVLSYVFWHRHYGSIIALHQLPSRCLCWQLDELGLWMNPCEFCLQQQAFIWKFVRKFCFTIFVGQLNGSKLSLDKTMSSTLRSTSSWTHY